ncbi:hypothetical protein [Undibacterium baiyunense]|uniref:Uncharacterized protein n=1 Tax=Undibacterium baiyunense TaxID=2828731 RepID=A0A941I411_9BURK|nr:hypothetical protein [Undibacterium baiyunense]MBR7747440.1 hypothetical protein [Undibacterium baiyunense]
MGIDTYLTVAFWLGILGLLIRSSQVIGKHPRKVEHEVGGDVFGLLIAIAFFVWVCFLKFGG